LRGCYPLRREFGSYAVKLSGASESLRKLIEAFGFRTE